MEHGSAPLSNPSTIAVILFFRVSQETLKNCVKSFYQECGALVGVSITNKLGDWHGGKLGLQHADSELNRLEDIEAHTRPSATGPAPTNPRAATMGRKVDANFIVSKVERAVENWPFSLDHFPFYRKKRPPHFTHVKMSAP